MAAAIGNSRVYVPSEHENTPRKLRCQQIAITAIFLGVAAVFANIWIGAAIVIVSSLSYQRLLWIDRSFNDGSTPLQEAASKGQKIWLRFLLFFGANPNKIILGNSPFTLAYDTGDFESAKLLIDYGADMSRPPLLGWTPLQIASNDGRTDVIQKILEKHPGLIQQRTSGDTPFNLACKRGHLDAARILMNHGADVMHITEWPNSKREKWTALQAAAYGGDLNLIRMILEKYPELIHQRYAGNTLFTLACQGKHLDAARILMDHGADVNVAEWITTKAQKWTALQAAAHRGDVNLIRMILEKHPELIHQKHEKNEHPFELACAGGELAAVELLMEKGANIEVFVPYEKFMGTVLHIAVQKKNTTFIRQVLQKAPYLLDQKDNRGWTPLYYACRVGSFEAARLLIELGADIREVNDDGETVLHAVAQNSKCAPLASMILNIAPELLGKQARDGTRPLVLALTSGCQDLARMLCGRGAKINLDSESECCAIRVAANKGHTESVRFILEIAPQLLEKSTIDEMTPLYCACMANKLETARCLISMGANRSNVLFLAIKKRQLAPLKSLLALIPPGDKLLEQKMDGFTPLGLACLYGHTPIVKLLLAHGVNINALNGPEAKTALHLASCYGHIEVIKALLETAPDQLEKTTSQDKTALYLACFHGHLDTARCLIENEANIYRVLCTAACQGDAITVLALVKISTAAKIEPDITKQVPPLYYACEKGNHEMVKLLISAGANLVTTLSAAAFRGNIAVIRFILDLPLDKKKTLEQKTQGCRFTPLGLACIQRHVNTAKFLIEQGADINGWHGPENYTALHLAALLGHTSMILMMLQITPDKARILEQRTVDALTPLFLACLQDHAEAARLLISNGADAFAVLCDAIARGNTTVIRNVLENSADKILEQKTPDEMTPLELACKNKQAEAARMLISKGADLLTVLADAVSRGNADIVQSLLEYAPDKKFLDKKTKDGKTPLMLACQQGQVAVAHILMSQGADAFAVLCDAVSRRSLAIIRLILNYVPDKKRLLDQKTDQGLTPLHLACQDGFVETAQVLIDYGADLHVVQEPAGWTPFHLAVLHRHLPILRMILGKAPDKMTLTERKTADGSTPLFWACQKGYLDVVQLLVENGANINARNEQALHQACKFGHVPVVKHLLAAGAEICPFQEQATPFSIAASFQQKEVLDLFFDHQNTSLRQAITLLKAKPLDSSVIFILNCLLRECLLRAAIAKTPFDVEYMDRNKRLLDAFLVGLQKPTLFTDHLQSWEIAYSKTEDCQKLQEMQRTALLICDRLTRIIPVHSFLSKATCLTNNDNLRGQYARFAEACGSKIATLNQKNPEMAFDEGDVFGLLAEVGLCIGIKINNVEISAKDAFESIMGVPMKRIVDKGLEEGKDLRKNGITFTLRFLSDKIETERPAILEELNRIESVILENGLFGLNRPLELLTTIADLKSRNFSKAELEAFHKDYVHAVLRCFLKR